MCFIVGLLISNSQIIRKDVLSCLLWDFNLWGMRTYNLEAKTPWIVSPLYNSSKRQLLVVLKTSLRKRMNREIMNSRLIGLETGEEQLLNKPSLVTCESHQVYSLIEISWWMQQISLVWLHFTILLRSWLLLAGYASYAGVGASSERRFSRVEKEDSVVALSGFRWKDENLRTRGTMTDLRATHGSRKLSECVFSKMKDTKHWPQNI